MIHPLKCFADWRRPLPRLLVMLAFATALAISWRAYQSSKRAAKVDPDRHRGFGYVRTVDDPMSVLADSVDLMAATDFKFSMGDGSGWHGFNTIKIAADGRCRYIFLQRVQVTEPDGSLAIESRWRGTEFSVTQETLRDLRKLLVEIDFFRLKAAYESNVLDGTQRWAWVQASAMQKRVWCSNEFPEPFQKLYKFVGDKVIRPHEQELQNAPLVTDQEARQAGAH